jgi:hypothetical protein
MDIYYINLDKRQDRRAHMEAEFANILPDHVKLYRWPAVSHSKGWIGCIQSHAAVLRHSIASPSRYPNFYPVLEDDCRINDKDHFRNVFPKYMEYLKAHSGEWDLFLGGGIYPIPKRIVCRDPFIIECDWMTCAHFVIYTDKSAKNVLEYAASEKHDVGIDNLNARTNRNRIWIPYPLFCDQLVSDTNIGTTPDYIQKIAKGFIDVHRCLEEFVAKAA